MKYLPTLQIILAGFFLTSCIGEIVFPSSRILVQEYTYEGYSGIEISDAFDVYVNFSDNEEKIEIETNENLLPYIIVAKEGSKLVIKVENRTNIRPGFTLKAYVTTSQISDIYLSGASQITLLDPLEAPDVSVEIEGASRLNGR